MTDDCFVLLAMTGSNIFKVGIVNGHDSLVLGALGCGAFRNPPDEVCRLFIDSCKVYGKYFKKVGFAILSLGTNNLEIFTKRFDSFITE